MREKKTSVYEGGHRVPLFVRWPAGRLAHGTAVDELSQVQDLLPTLIELCGLKTIKWPMKFDGLSLAGHLRGAVSKWPDRKLVVQYRTSGEPWDPAVVMWDKWRLLKPKKGRQPQDPNAGLELYHVGRDPGQKENVAAKHPEVAEEMRKHYEKWHVEAKKQFDRPRWITVGSEAANPMILYSQDWVGDYCDNPGGLRRATAMGYWNVDVDRQGVYEIELRRWPKESKKTLTEGWNGPEDKGESARPIAAANLQVAGGNYTLDTSASDTHAAFRVKLPAGKTQLSTAFLDREGRALGSAIYVYLNRIEDGKASKALTPPSSVKPEGRAPARQPARKGGKKAASSPKAVELAADDILIADFEGDEHAEGWTTRGEVFHPVDARNKVAGVQGKKLVDTFLLKGSDKPTGTLYSPVFKVERDYINFLIGGGHHPGETGAALLLGKRVLYSANGNSTKNSDNKKVLEWVSWDVSNIKGEEAQFQIYDRRSGGWGHIVVDHVYQSDKPAAGTAKKQVNAGNPEGKPGRVAGTKPNILIIFTDDQGYADFGCFGSRTNKTPRMDLLAAEGTTFTSFYAQPVCGPSRSALLTGRYPSRSGGWGMPADEITWAELIRDAGYQTACIGKVGRLESQADHRPHAARAGLRLLLWGTRRE